MQWQQSVTEKTQTLYAGCDITILRSDHQSGSYAHLVGC